MRTLFLPVLLGVSVLVGCMPAEVDIALDLDRDGLLSDVEAEMGTDPNDPDSDGDEWSDGDEVDQNTDPLSADSKPYYGGYQIDACHEDVQPTGFQMGDVIENLQAKDQFGDTVELHHFCNKVVALIGASDT